MQPRNNPISCNDLIITLVIVAILVGCSIAWLYIRAENSSKENLQLSTNIIHLKDDSSQKTQIINVLNSDIKKLSTTRKIQTEQVTNSLASIEVLEKSFQQSQIVNEEEKSNFLKKIETLKIQLSAQQNDIIKVNKENSAIGEQLTHSKQDLKESRILSAQQFNEFKQLKRILNQTQFEANQRLKEINEWQIEVSQLKIQLKDTKIKISQPKQRFTVFEMDQDILFNKGEVNLKGEGKTALDTLAQIFQQYPNRQIAIQGHSDNQKLGSRLKKKYNSNWELAAARAASAIHYLQHVKSIAPQRIILVSFAHYRPKQEGSSANNFAKNRRIEITLMPKNFDFVHGLIK